MAVPWSPFCDWLPLHFFDALSEQTGWSVNGLEDDLYQVTRQFILHYNECQPKGQKYTYRNLTPMQIAYLINFIYPVRRIPCAGESGNADQDLLAIYQRHGPKKGLYDHDSDTLEKIAGFIKSDITKNEITEVTRCLRRIVRRVNRCKDPDLVVVNNGIFNYRTKMLIPFDPKYVFGKIWNKLQSQRHERSDT